MTLAISFIRNTTFYVSQKQFQLIKKDPTVISNCPPKLYLFDNIIPKIIGFFNREIKVWTDILYNQHIHIVLQVNLVLDTEWLKLNCMITNKDPESISEVFYCSAALFHNQQDYAHDGDNSADGACDRVDFFGFGVVLFFCEIIDTHRENQNSDDKTDNRFKNYRKSA